MSAEWEDYTLRRAAGGNGWRGGTQPPPAPKPEDQLKKKAAGAGLVLAVQSFACVAVLLLALLVRFVGGDAYEQLRHRFNEQLASGDLLAALAALWDGDPTEAVSAPLQEINDHAPAVTDPQDAPTTAPDRSGETTQPSGSTDASVPSSAPTASGVSLPGGVAAVSLRVNRVAYPPLTAGAVTSGYGYRDDPFGTGEREFHRGIDIAASAGAPIAAMFFGTVKAVGSDASYGNYIRIAHGDGVEVLYAHCSAIVAQEGATVRPGETVALVGATGRATGSHLHVEVRENGIVYNPTAIVPTVRYARDA